MSQTDSTSPPQAGQIQRVSSPTLAESLRMTYRSIRNRLGRAIITWLGIAFGIAFLMFTLVSSEIRQSISAVTERRTAVQSMVTTLRAEVGDLRGKTITIMTVEPIEDQQLLDAFTQWLTKNRPQLKVNGPTPLSRPGDDTKQFAGISALILWSGPKVEPDLAGISMARMKQRVVLS